MTVDLREVAERHKDEKGCPLEGDCTAKRMVLDLVATLAVQLKGEAQRQGDALQALARTLAKREAYRAVQDHLAHDHDADRMIERIHDAVRKHEDRHHPDRLFPERRGRAPEEERFFPEKEEAQ